MTISELKSNITQFNILVVINYLHTILIKSNSPFQTKLLIIQSEFNEYKQNELIYNESDLSRKRMKITMNLLNFVEDIKNEIEVTINDNVESTELKYNILFLSSNPSDTSYLKVDKEFVEIKKLLQESNDIDKIQLNVDTNITPNKLHKAIQKYKPNIFHFSGHGFQSNDNQLTGLIIEDEKGNRKVLNENALDGLFDLISEENTIEVVILNACYSLNQSVIIKKYVNNVIGMNDSISDYAAILFSTGFYRALANGKSIDSAFKYGKNMVALDGRNEEDKLVLINNSIII